ncbi:hypothetical protein NO932_01120 [Pelagibacterium sp. 26DY04]|uniref:hypothetical protein n=1 Tax=Pelagibacterium sp. 26DY04 TaxID=2967130 RepID=UPI0028169B64|nr:hypothetical protein [Pelagibacterium sp. 26DY04]WMT87232.1 hypothetical protein NO932_01120 [Pelagibacterium sp. 26DY04]
MNILRAAVLAIGLGLSAPATAQPAPSLASSAEAGWTSNVEGTADGGADFYITHTHSLGITTGEGDFALRGTIIFEDTRYGELWRENDWAASATLEAETRLGADTALRGSLLISYGEEGQSLATLAGPLGIVQPNLAALARLRAETALGDAIAGADFAYAAQRPGNARFEANLLPPARTEAVTDTLTAGLDLAYPLSPTAALAARAQYSAVLVSSDEQAAFVRFPLSIARLATGFDLSDGAQSSATLRAGIDLLIPEDTSIDSLLTPYAEFASELAVNEILTLATTLEAATDTEDPADGLADWRLKARGSILLTPAPQWALEAAGFAKQIHSPALDLLIETEHGAELIARWMPAGGLHLEALARYRRVEGLAPTYDETRIGLRISAAI